MRVVKFAIYLGEGGVGNGWDFVTGLDDKGGLMIRISTAVNTHYVCYSL